EALPRRRRRDARRIDPWPVRADHDADGDAEEDHHERRPRADEAAEEVRALRDRRAEEERMDADLEVLLDGASGDRADHRDADEAEDADSDRERVGAVDEDLV